MDLTTNGVVIADTLKYVTQKAEHVNALHKLNEIIKAVDEEEGEWEEKTTTTNSIC